MYCKKICSGAHAFCGGGQQWQKCYDHSFVPPRRDQSQRRVQWNYNQTGWEESEQQDSAQWVQPPRRRKSPRQRSKKAQTRTAPAKGKGKGKSSEDALHFGPSPLPAPSNMEPPWMTPNLTSAPSAPVHTPVSRDSTLDKEKDKHLRTLVAALKKHKEEMPEDVQQLMKEMNARSGQEETKLLHAAVSQHGRAKKEVQAAQAARFQMHTAWRNFLSQSAQQWQTYAAQFMEQEKLLTERLQTAKENLSTAKENLGNCKVAAGLEEKEDTNHAQRLRRTGMQGHPNHCWQTHCREFHHPEHKSSGSALTSRPSSATRGGRSESKKAANWSPYRRGSLKLHSNETVFWRGRVNTAQSIAHWPAKAGTKVVRHAREHIHLRKTPSHGVDPIPWLHSVTQECDFKDPWTAQDLAFHLAVQIAQELHDDFPQVTNGRSPQLVHKSKHRSSVMSSCQLCTQCFSIHG